MPQVRELDVDEINISLDELDRKAKEAAIAVVPSALPTDRPTNPERSNMILNMDTGKIEWYDGNEWKEV
jgi:hypothetical protein